MGLYKNRQLILAPIPAYQRVGRKGRLKEGGR